MISQAPSQLLQLTLDSVPFGWPPRRKGVGSVSALDTHGPKEVPAQGDTDDCAKDDEEIR